MNIAKEFCNKLDILGLSVIMSGTQPVLDRRFRGRKYSVIGIFFTINNLSLLFYCHHVITKLEKDFPISNPILRGIVSINRLIYLSYPVHLTLNNIFRRSTREKILMKMGRLEEYLVANGINMYKIKREESFWRGKATVVEIVSIVAAVISYNYFFLKLYDSELPLTEIYTSLLTNWIFIINCLKAHNALRCLKVRMQLYIKVILRIERDLHKHHGKA